MKNFQRCVKCILPHTYPGIGFDEMGVCNVCNAEIPDDGTPKLKKDKSMLDKIIRANKDRNGKYDLIVGLSGGKDSTYTAYYLKKEYDAKILGFNYDIGYRSVYATDNIDRVTDKLDVDLITMRPKKAFLKKLFAHFLIKRGEFCSVCNNLGYLMSASFAWSERRSLGFSPLLVGGWSKKYEFQPGISVTSMQYFFENLTDDLFQELLLQPFIHEEVVKRYRHLHDPRQAQIGTDAYNQLGPYAMNLIQLPDFIDWDIRSIPNILESRLGWTHPSDLHESHFDCLLFPIKEYLKFKKYGLTQETIKNSVLIREGLLSREEALDRSAMEQTKQPAIMDTFLAEIGLTKDDINWNAAWSTH